MSGYEYPSSGQCPTNAGRQQTKKSIKNTVGASKVIEAFNTWAFKREQPSDLALLTRTVQARLSKSVVLHTCAQAAGRGQQQTRWSAEVGAGVLRASKLDARAATAVAMARGISRTAWSYPSRVAWLDETSGDIVGMPVMQPR